MIADNIVATIRNGSPPGRFLAKNPKNGLWESVDDNRAREKVKIDVLVLTFVRVVLYI